MKPPALLTIASTVVNAVLLLAAISAVDELRRTVVALAAANRAASERRVSETKGAASLHLIHTPKVTDQ